MRLIVITLLLLSHSWLQGQSQLDISFWSDVMINANAPEHRLYALDKFQESFKERAENMNVFDFDFTKTPEITVVGDSSNTFKIMTWQVVGADYDFQYFGYLLKNTGEVISLDDAFDQLDDLEYLSLGADEWIGGIYYNLVEQDGKYFLFSYRQLDEFTKFKSFDCLSFDDKGQPVLGEELFVKPMEETRDIIKNRVIFTYSADAILSLNYNPAMNMVVHDHLTEVIGQREGQGPTKVPDGTYEGWVFEEGQWIYEEKLFSHTYDEAPRPNQVLGKSQKDLFGKQEKKN